MLLGFTGGSVLWNFMKDVEIFTNFNNEVLNGQSYNIVK